MYCTYWSGRSSHAADPRSVKLWSAALGFPPLWFLCTPAHMETLIWSGRRRWLVRRGSTSWLFTGYFCCHSVINYKRTHTHTHTHTHTQHDCLIMFLWLLCRLLQLVSCLTIANVSGSIYHFLQQSWWCHCFLQMHIFLFYAPTLHSKWYFQAFWVEKKVCRRFIVSQFSYFLFLSSSECFEPRCLHLSCLV